MHTMSVFTTYNTPTLTYHESIPGHVWQGEYTFKLPLARSLLAFNAYSEGWALYAEQLANELGVYDDDPFGRLGYLQSIAFRACRLVVDTGLHAKRWTRKQAIDWFASTNGSSVEEVTGEVDRYCAWPGQACGYKVGHSEINRLRAKAQKALGSRFDLRQFNDVGREGRWRADAHAGAHDRCIHRALTPRKPVCFPMNENIKYFAGAVAVVGLSVGAVIYISRHPTRRRRTCPPWSPHRRRQRYPRNRPSSILCLRPKWSRRCRRSTTAINRCRMR